MDDIANENKAISRLRQASTRLLLSKPFFSHIYMNTYKNIGSLSGRVDTMAVSLKGIGFQLIVNPKFINRLTDSQADSVLFHEVLHLAYGHLILSQKGLYSNKQIANIAMDICINQIVGKWNFPNGDKTKKEFENYYEGVITHLKLQEQKGQITAEEIKDELSHPKNFYGCYQEDYFPDDPNKASLWYYKELLKKEQENPGSVVPQYAIGDLIEIDGEGVSEVDKALLEKTLGGQLKAALDATGGDGRGFIDQELQGWIDAAFSGKEASVSWNTMFRMFIHGSIKILMEPTRNKPSKRFGAKFPGQKLLTRPRGIIYWDQSGSVSKEQHRQLFDELHHIYKTGVDIDIAPFNTQVLKVYKYKGENSHTVAGGGTDFDICQEHFSKVSNKYSFAIMFTDGYAPVPKRFHKPCIWVLTQEQQMEEDFPGKKILMKT